MLGPVPARIGEPVCVKLPSLPDWSRWWVFNSAGQQVSQFSFGAAQQACWATAGLRPGVYYLRVELGWPGGGSQLIRQKTVLAP